LKVVTPEEVSLTTCPRCPTSSAGCHRCKRPHCAEHLKAETCVACELEYYESRDQLPTGMWYGLGFFVPWAAFTALITTVDLPSRSGGVRAFTTGLPALDVAIMTAVVAVFAGKLAVKIRRWLHRREFDRTPVASHALIR